MKKTLLLTLLLSICFGVSHAQKKKSYLYLEVSKNLPVNIKLNDGPIKNERRGYVLITNLKEGTNFLSFDFANPEFKNHEFQINNTGEKSMGLKLARVSDNRFVLQDVVNKRIISDQRTLNASPIAIREKLDENTAYTSNKQTKKVKTKTGVIKEYRATKEVKKTKVEKGIVKEYNSKTDLKKQTNKISKVKKEKKTIQEVIKAEPITAEPRTYAMYKNRRPMSPTRQSKRYKNYRKTKREARRNAKLLEREKAELAEKSSKVEEKTVKEKVTAEKENASEAAAKEAKRLRKEERIMRREKRREELLQKEKVEIAQREKNRAAKKKLDEEKKRQRLMLKKEAAKKREIEKAQIQIKENQETKSVDAEVRKTKKKTVVNSKRQTKKNALGIGEKIINAEPVGNAGRTKKVSSKEVESEDVAYSRCTNSVRSERVADWTIRLHKKFDDEAREKYIEKKLGKKCISSNNLSVLLSNMDTQIGRYKLIKNVYPQLEDPANLDKFYKFFPSQSYIVKLKELRTEVNN